MLLTRCNRILTGNVLLIIITTVGLHCHLAFSDEWILLSPPHLLVPVGTANISFLCETNFSSAQSGYDIHWRKNNNLIQNCPNLEINENPARLHIPIATYDLDNTTFDCFIEYHGERNPQRVYSNDATLLVINETSSPVKPNPRIECTTECPDPSLRLVWSPPYLWSGKYIDHFNVSIIRKNDGRVLYTERIKRLIDREIESMCICQTLNYSEGFFFEIKAYTVNRDMHITLLNGTGNFNETEEFPSGIGNLELKTRILIDTDAKLVLQTLVKLPKLCSYEEIILEYTIINSDNLSIYNETFYNIESEIYYQEIDSAQVNLTLDEDYTLEVKMTQSTLGMTDITFETLNNFSTVFPLQCSRYNMCCSNFQPNIRSSFKLLISLLVLFVIMYQ